MNSYALKPKEYEEEKIEEKQKKKEKKKEKKKDKKKKKSKERTKKKQNKSTHVISFDHLISGSQVSFGFCNCQHEILES